VQQLGKEGAGASSPASLGGGVEGMLPTDLPTRIFDDLLGRIIGGSLASGERLPSERALTEAFGVNRQVVREALKRLAQLGLVAADRGNGNVVLDWRRTGSFDLLPLLAARALGDRGPGPLLTARHLLELRLSFALSVTHLCVQHASEEQVGRLVESALAISDYPDVAQRFAAEWQMWHVAVEGSGNVALGLMLNSLRDLAGPGLLLMARASLTVPGDPTELVAAARAIAGREVDSADALVRHAYRIEPTAELRAAEAQLAEERVTAGG
jgi:GntR family transcriptional repressor for pyruvate dehydrogenase complex